ncbi:MAG TPA: response regulator [Bacteroidales bacterium]|nr:response regulator [Bacteroidales bacterium]
MAEIYIICIEDEPQVLDVIVKDLEVLEEVFPIEVAGSVAEAHKVIKEIHQQGGKIGLALCDHIMPGEYGVDLLIEMHNNPLTRSTRKVLITGQAGLDDTVLAINKARLNHYIAKPWNPKELLEVAKNELTQYVIAHEKDLLRFMSVLDPVKIQEEIRNRGYV